MTHPARLTGQQNITPAPFQHAASSSCPHSRAARRGKLPARRNPLACARLLHYGGGQLAVAYLHGQLGDRRDLGYLKRRSARGLGRILIAEVRE